MPGEIFRGVEISTYLKATAKISELEKLVREMVKVLYNCDDLVQWAELVDRPEVRKIMEGN